MVEPGTILLKSNDVVNLLSIDECIAAVEQAFNLYAEGKTLPPKVVGIHTEQGGFHIKAALLQLRRSYFVTKINANFPDNTALHDLPTIQGVIAVFDGTNGRLLALIDSIEITILRTGAATAIAAKYLSQTNARAVTICGCGKQGRITLKALMQVRQLESVYVYDINRQQAQKFVQEFSSRLNIITVDKDDLPNILKQSNIIVTCTPSKEPFIRPEYISPGSFIAAVGADSEEKQELFPELLATSKVIVDIAEQSAVIGELHHAIEKGLVTIAAIHSELGYIIAGKKPGRESDSEIIIFDSTGTALQDVAAAAIVYEKAAYKQIGSGFNFFEPAGNSAVSEKVAKEINALKSFYPFR